MRTWNKVVVALIFFCLYSCAGSSDESETSTPTLYISDTSLTPAKSNEAAVPVVDSAQLTLDNKLSIWFDLASMKEDIGFLEMGTSLPYKYIPKIDSTQHRYNYGAVGGLVLNRKIPVKMGFQKLKEFNKKFLSISTYKPWNTPEEKYYKVNNEIIVGFESIINYDRLGTYNLVGEMENSVFEKLGSPSARKKECNVYFGNGKALVLHFENQKVDWLKCYALSDSCFNNRLLPEEIYTWNLK